MKYERLWERLVEHLDSWATARVVGPDRIAVDWVHPDGDRRTTELVMTASEWEDMVMIPYGDFDLAAADVRRSVSALPADQRYLVYRSYQLVPSDSPGLPPDAEDLRIQDLARRHPEGFGRWVVHDDDGNVVSELGPPSWG